MALYQPEFIALVGFHWGDSFLRPGGMERPHISGGAMLQSATAPQATTHARVISTLTHLRQEWQDATVGVSLLETNGNIGLMLADLINGLGLEAQEQQQILGNDLFHELRDFLYAPKHN